MKSVADTQAREHLGTIPKPLAEGSAEKRKPLVANYASLSTRLLALNGLAIVAVILNHSSFWAFEVISWTPDKLAQMGRGTYYTLRAVEQLIMFAVPTFIFISGYFIAFAIGRIEANKQWKVIFNRIKNLIIPFLIWSVLILVLDMLLGNPHTVKDFILTVITGRTRGPYYFALLLSQYLLLSPLLVSLARTRYKMLLLVTGLLQLAVIGLRYDTFSGLNLPALQPILFIDLHNFFPSYIFFFTFGIVYNMHFAQSKYFREQLIQARWKLLAALVALFILGMVEWEILQKFAGKTSVGQLDTNIDGLYSLVFILCFLAFEEFIPPFAKQLGTLGTMSYGIYLLHWSVQEYIAKAINRGFPWLMDHQILMQPLLIICGLGLPVILMTFVKKSPLQRYYRYLFG